MSLSRESKEEISWWENNIHTSFKNIKEPRPDHVITTDASGRGWGAVFNGQSTGGQWSFTEGKAHINVLELKAVLFGLEAFCSNLEGKHIRVRIDNTTAVAYVNKLGGVKSIECHRIVKRIWLWAIDKGFILSAEFLPGSKNVLADRASRIFDENTEWSLKVKGFETISKVFGPFEIDLFASRLNAKTPVYVAWKPDPKAKSVDAFGVDWSTYYFYAFPPFSLISQCLQKIVSERATGVVIAPLWTTQVWYPKLTRLLVAPPLILPLHMIHLPFRPEAVHRQEKTLRLMACLLSGDSLRQEVFQKSLSTSCVPRGDGRQLFSMKSILESGFVSAIDGKMIPCNFMKLK